MTTNTDAYMAGADAAIADPTLNRGGFADAIRTVADLGVSDAEAKAWIDELATEYERLGIINNPTYAQLRAEIINEGSVTARSLFDALGTSINGLVSTAPINLSVTKTDLRAERDQADANITILQGLRAGQPRQVKEAINIGIANLRQHKQNVITELQSLGDAP